MSINAIGGYGYDPYFMAAYQSYNPNFKGATQTGTTMPSPQSPTGANTSFQGKNTEVKNSNSTAGLILTGAATIGTGFLLYKAHKKGGEKGIVEGFKQLWKGIVGKNKSIENQFTIRKTNDGKWFCTIPEANNVIIKNKTANFETVAKNLGLETQVIPHSSGNETKLVDLAFTYKGKKVHIKNGNIVSLKDVKTQKDIIQKLNSNSPANKKFQADLKNIIADINSGGKNLENLTNNNTDFELKYLNYIHSSEGTTKHFIQKGTNAPELRKITTNRFDLGSNSAVAYSVDHPKIQETLDLIKNNKAKEANIKIYSCILKNKNNVDFKIENGEITGFYNIKGSRKLFVKKDSSEYKAWLYNHKDELPDLKNLDENNNIENVVYTIAA